MSLFIDIAANLTDAVFDGVYNGTSRHPPDRASVLGRATDAGVVRTIVTAGDVAGSSAAASLAATAGTASHALYSTVGVHPTRAGSVRPLGATGFAAAAAAAGTEATAERVAEEDEIAGLAAVARAAPGRVVAVGECGLDYDRLQFCDATTQRAVFDRHFPLAAATDLPLFLHCRGSAFPDFFDALRRHRGSFRTGVVHSFTGTAAERDAVLAIPGLYLGVNGCSLKTADNIDVVRGIPLDRLLLETDAPYCGIRGTHAGVGHVRSMWAAKDKKKWEAGATVKGRVEPCHIRAVAEVVAATRGVDVDVVARAAWDNSMAVFWPAEASAGSYDAAVAAARPATVP
ncbi:hypothetical protein MMPV_004484 [Pyropia vietnamensis]